MDAAEVATVGVGTAGGIGFTGKVGVVGKAGQLPLPCTFSLLVL